MAIPSNDMLNRLRYLDAPTRVSLTTSTARSTLLDPGVYAVTCDADAFILQGGSGVNATTTSVPIWSKTYITVFVNDANDGYIAGILSSGTATLHIVKRT